MLGRDPEFLMLAAAHSALLELAGVGFFNFKARDETNVVGVRARRIPVPRDLLGVFELEDGIEDRLIGQSRRKGLLIWLSSISLSSRGPTGRYKIIARRLNTSARP